MSNPTQKDVKTWVDASRYDLQTARALLASRRYVYVLFMCQQSLEKLLKAHVTWRTNELAPRIHNLLRLGEMSSLEFSHEERALLERLSLYYIQTRYPPEAQALAKKVGRAMAEAYLDQTEALWQLLRRRLKQKN